MAIIDISHNDSLRTVIQKCNQNFRQLAFSGARGIQNQEISLGMQGSEDTMPPVGMFLLIQYDPSEVYMGTTWQQVGNVITDTNVTVSLWQRTG